MTKLLTQNTVVCMSCCAFHNKVLTQQQE